VVEASDGDMAWQMATARLPDLIILDVVMPGMSGWEVCRKIREAVSLAHTGVIMLTGIGESLNEMTSPLYGADAYVDKPFELADLERSIVETLRKRRAGAIGRNDDDAPPSENRATIRSPAFDGLLAKKAGAAKAAKPTKEAVKAAPVPKKGKPVKKAAAKKAPAKKPAAKKAPAKKAAPKKAPVKAAKKAAPKKAPAKKAAAKKAATKPVAKKGGAKKPAKKKR
jgi:CheY-like chemotaxis protein